jgi:3-oxoisoapionate-4-phosphate decarboxylase
MNTILVKYLVESPDDPQQVAERLATNQSTGTFTPVPGETDELRARFQIKVKNVHVLGRRAQPSCPILPASRGDTGSFAETEITLAIPLETVGTDLSTLLAVVAGGGFDARGVSAIRLLDLVLPEIFARENPGPQFGIPGTRRLCGVQGRPIIGSIIKPSIGLTPEQTARMVSELAKGGADFIKDDEKLTSTAHSPFEDRVKQVMAAILDAEGKSGRRVMYAFNVSCTDPEVMVRRHDLVLEAGGSCVLVNINQVGLAGLAYLRRRSGLPIHAHRNGWGALTRCPSLGWDFSPYNRIWRLAGIDHIHVNGLRNKYWEPDESVIRAIRDCITPIFGDRDRVFPVIGSGQWAGQVDDTFRQTGTLDLIFLAGGGIQGHPGGPAAGVASLRQAWAAAIAGVPAAEYARSHAELRQAFEKFGGIRF